MGKSQELENLRLRLTQEEDRHSESRKEVSKLKTKVRRDNHFSEASIVIHYYTLVCECVFPYNTSLALRRIHKPIDSCVIVILIFYSC